MAVPHPVTAPRHSDATTPRVGGQVAQAVELLRGRRLVALTGAGMSTDSGIPDYRGPDSPPRRPMTYGEFTSGDVARQRYWARSHIGWRHMHGAEPNNGHRALADLETQGSLTGLITQNVDGLHQAAGSKAVIDLHGRIADVVCLSCRATSSRAELHRRFDVLNPGFADREVVFAPDGDALMDDVDGFVVASCLKCGGVLKPDIVFFGENVPKPRVAEAYALVDSAATLLVAGSSLTVMSGLRFVRYAHRRDIPIVIVNRGITRGDALATVKVDAGCSETLSAVLEALLR